jgi:hypothetical protein
MIEIDGSELFSLDDDLRVDVNESEDADEENSLLFDAALLPLDEENVVVL